MKKKRILLLFLFLAVLILELLPQGVILRFANPEGEPWQRGYSYFSLVPFGYGNVGPLLTALLSCVTPIFILIGFFPQRRGGDRAVAILSILAVFTSLMPLLLFGFSYATVTGFAVTLTLALSAVLAILLAAGEEGETLFLLIKILTALLFAMLILPAVLLQTVKPEAGLVISLFFFFILYPILSFFLGIGAERNMRRLWFTPLLVSLAYQGFSYLAYAENMPLIYSTSYGVICLMGMWVPRLIKKKREKEQ